jgi:uncharacterized protein
MRRRAHREQGPAAGLKAGLAALALLLSFAIAVAAPTFPPVTGRVVDEARLLSADHVARIAADLAAFEKKSSDQLVVVTLKSLQGYAIEDYGYQLGRAWKIGQGGVNNGVLLIVAPNERKVRIEVGRGLEPQLTDALSQLIIQNAILPAFRRGDWVGGITAGVRDISSVLLGDTEEVRRRLASGQRRTPVNRWDWLIPLLFWLAIVAIVVYVQLRQSRSAPVRARDGRRRRQDRYNDDVFVSPGGWGGSGSWGGGGSGGGGGFSGGGGDFGGGGSSGSW